MFKIYILGAFLSLSFFSVSRDAYAGQQAATYGKASGNTIGKFSNCKIGVPCLIKISTNVRPSIRQCQYYDSVPPLIRSWNITEEARALGISASGFITIYPPGGAVALSVGQSHVTYHEWGDPGKCGRSETPWPIRGIKVTFTRPIQRSDLPVRILAMGRGRKNFIQGFNTKAGRNRAAVNIVIDGSFADANPEVISPFCSVSGNAIIEHDAHTPDAIKNNIAKSSLININCNANVKAEVSIRGERQISGRPANWTQCGYGACEITINGGNKFDINKQKTIQFISTWRDLGNTIKEGKFQGAAIASISYK